MMQKKFREEPWEFLKDYKMSCIGEELKAWSI